MSYPVPNFKLSQILAYLILYILSRSSCPIPPCLGYRSEDRKNRAHDLILDLEYDLVGNGKRRDYPAGNEAIKQDIPSYPVVSRSVASRETMSHPVSNVAGNDRPCPVMYYLVYDMLCINVVTKTR